ADERRVSDNEIGFWPSRRLRIDIALSLHPCRGIRHLAAAYRVFEFGDPVPTMERLTPIVAHQLGSVPGHQRVPVLDRPDITQDRLARHAVGAIHPEMPLQIADPQYELGDRRRARVDLNPEEILWG